MSLQQLAAQRMAAQGRGPDTQLVHMSPREVAGLQALAMAQGGSLTINPETGLPEAGFLDSMLPMILGIGAMALTGGAAGAAMPGLFGMGMPATIGLGVGALQTARTGSLEKGLMAGLGAYGGAGLAGGLMAAGAGAGAGAAGAAGAEVGSLGAAQAAPAFDPAGMVASPQVDLSVLGPDAQALIMQGEPIVGQANAVPYHQVLSDAEKLMGPPSSFDAALNPSHAPSIHHFKPITPPPHSIGGQGTAILPEGAGVDTGSYVDSSFTNTSNVNPAAYITETQPAYTPNIQPVDAANRLSPGDVALRKQPVPSFGNNLRQMGRGISALAEPGGREAFMGQAASKGVEATGVGGGMGLLKYGAAAAAPLLVSDTKTKMPAEDNERYNYRFDAGRTEEGYVDPVTGTRQYFRPTYTRYAAAGGPIEDMSMSNVYAMQNARGGVSDMGIDNSTGMQRMAGGGISALKPFAGYGDDEVRNNYSYDPTTKTYAKLAPVIPPAAIAATLNALEAGGYGGGEMSAGPGLAGLSAAAQGETYGDAAIGAFDAASADAAAGAAGAAAGAAAGSGLGYGAGGYDGGGEGTGGYYAKGGGISHLGDYSDGGRLLRGPGDGVSDSIPAMIGRKQPARLADGEFVVPARIVSELGNGSTEAGARKLYAMMDRVQKARGKTTGKNRVAANTRSEKYLPA